MTHHSSGVFGDPEWDPEAMWHNLCPWLTLEWLGHCTLSSPWAQRRIRPSIINIANLSILKKEAHSVFYWYEHLAAIFAPSIGLRIVTGHIEAVTKFTDEP